MKMPVVVCTAAAVTLAFVGVAFAGERISYNVSVDTTNRYALGSLGTAYNSSDTTSYLACSVYANAGQPLQAGCIARTASGAVGSCATNDPGLITVINGLSSDSYVFFEWNSVGQCTYIAVDKASFTDPKR